MKLDDHFLGIWHRAQQHVLSNLSPALIESWASARGLTIDSVAETEIGAFQKTKCIVLTVSGKQACFPKVGLKDDPNWQLRRSNADQEAALWEKMEWFLPLWVPLRDLQPLLKDVAYCTKERAIEFFDYHTSTIYTVPFQAVCIAQIMPKARSLQDFCALAREAYLAFYSGYRASSIAALIPAIEGALTNIVSTTGADLTIPDRVDRVVNRAIALAASIHFERMWVPPEYLKVDYLFGQDERVFMFETFRRWLHNSFFCKTSDYDGVTWLNRHFFAHATSSSWQQSTNFSRLVVVLATLGVIESWHDESNNVSLFFPEMDDDGKLLWQQALFQAETQIILKTIQEKRYHDHGRLVPELPMDDGVLLRKAILSEDCINDLVRPLRDAGWSIEVGEPDERALHVTVTATCGTEKFSVSLLYSCATDNKIYKKLAETSKAILYRGAPYHQDQYAYGLAIHVGPVAAWQPPPTPH